MLLWIWMVLLLGMGEVVGFLWWKVQLRLWRVLLKNRILVLEVFFFGRMSV